MKHAVIDNAADIFHKLETIEKETVDLKLSILGTITPPCKKIISLKGILKGIIITEKDIASAKKSLCCNVV